MDDVVVVVVVLEVVEPVTFNVGIRRAAARFAALVTPIDGDTDIRPFEFAVAVVPPPARKAAEHGATAHKTGKIPIIVVRNFILFPLLVSIHYIIEKGRKKVKSVYECKWLVGNMKKPAMTSPVH